MTTEILYLFTDEQKEIYYKMAEEYLVKHNLECIKIDRDKFAYSGKDKIVKISFLPFSKKTVSREQLAYAKTLEHVVITNDRYSRPKKGLVVPTRENGYIKFFVGKEE